MPQVKVFGLRGNLEAVQDGLADAIHSSIRDALGVTSDKRFQRYFSFDPESFLHGPGRSDQYTVIEIFIFEGRTEATRKRLIHLLVERIRDTVGIPTDDIEIMIFELPRCNWGVRGMTGDELHLDYPIDR